MTELGAPGTLARPKPCGECGMCCKLAPVPELGKAAGDRCRHFAKGRGCTIQATKPASCRDYQCIWTYAAPLDDSWRPDRAGFILQPGAGNTLEVLPHPAAPNSWRAEPYYAQLKAWADYRTPGRPLVTVRTRGHAIVIFPEEDVDLGPVQPDKHIEYGYAEKDGKVQPFARFIDVSPAPSLARQSLSFPTGAR